MALATLGWLCPGWRPFGEWVFAGSRHTLIATLFLIGASLAPDTLRAIGWRPLALGLGLWTVSATGALLFALTLR